MSAVQCLLLPTSGRYTLNVISENESNLHVPEKILTSAKVSSSTSPEFQCISLCWLLYRQQT